MMLSFQRDFRISGTGHITPSINSDERLSRAILPKTVEKLRPVML